MSEEIITVNIIDPSPPKKKKKKEHGNKGKKWAKPRSRGLFPVGNNHREILNTPELRKLAYMQYCDHIAQGFSKLSWTLHHDSIRCTYWSIENAIKKYTEELDPILKQVAEAQGRKAWEQKLFDIAIGKNLKGNVAAAQMIMRNMFGWDKPIVASQDAIQSAMTQFATMRGFLEEKGRQLGISGTGSQDNAPELEVEGSLQTEQFRVS